MRPYLCNSPQAAARIVALAMLADGDICMAELDAIERLDGYGQLGLLPLELHTIVHDCWSDLLSAAHRSWDDECRADPQLLAELITEVYDPALRLKVLHLCVAVVEADGEVAEGESAMLVATVEHWGLQSEMLRPLLLKRDVQHV